MPKRPGLTISKIGPSVAEICLGYCRGWGESSGDLTFNSTVSSGVGGSGGATPTGGIVDVVTKETRLKNQRNWLTGC